MKPVTLLTQNKKSSAFDFPLTCLWCGFLFNYFLHQYYDLPYPSLWTMALEALVGGLGFLVGYLVNLITHELGHASAALFLKCPVYVVEVGVGPTLINSFKFLGLPWRLRSYPTSAIVRWGPTSLNRARLQHAFVTSAGPLVSLLLFAPQVLVFNSFNVHEDYWTPLHWPMAFWTGLLGSSVAILCGTCLPYYFKRDGRMIPTDAMKLITLPWQSNETIYEQVKAVRINLHAEKLFDAGVKSPEEALAMVDKNPDDLKALITASQLLHAKGDPRGLELARQSLAVVGPEDRGIVIDFYVTICLNLGCLPTEPNGWEILQESYEEDKIGIGNRITYAAGLIDFGNDAEGLPILEEAVKKAKVPINLAYTHLFLAIVKKKAGDTKSAGEHAAKAAKFYPSCPGLKRVADLLPPKPLASPQSQPASTGITTAS